ncbi:MAG: glycosyltransferase family 39 protein [Bacteroidota bacterium]|nr:glycosyltransferase family 39 protein [Bacteroidota bacterium]
MKTFDFRFVKEHKYLFLIAFLNFVLIYASSFVKAYGYFIDEFYYIACAARPAFGYVDHPPLAPLVLTVFQLFFGTSLLAIRILPALAASASVFLTGILAKEIGGGRFAQCLAACAAAACPVIAAMGGLYSMNIFETLLAVVLLIFAGRMIKENDPKRWIVLGIVMGLGMMNKHTFAVFILGVVFSLIVAGQWRLVFNKWFAAGSLIALLIFLPNILWQAANNYPSLEFYRNISAHKNVYTPPLAFFRDQIMWMSPFTFPVWFAGIIFLLLSKSVKSFRFLSVLFLSLFLFMMLSGTSRPDRLTFAYSAVFAGGGFFFENFIFKHNARWLKGVLLVFLYAGLALSLPLILPYFPYESVREYTRFIGMNTEQETGNKPPLPQILADRIGWEEKFKLVLNAYQSLPDSEKPKTIIAAENYGQAGALELYGKKYHFPFVASGHNTYYLWSRKKLESGGGFKILLQLGHERE